MIISQENVQIDFTFFSRTDGTEENPLLINVTSSQKSSESLFIHMKIGEKYHEYILKRVNSSGTCNLICSVKSCKCTAKISIDQSFIKKIPEFYSIGNGRFRAKYYLEVNDPNLRILENWTVVPHISLNPHNNYS